ncbi:unnamed protein product [Urochloa humidicola]
MEAGAPDLGRGAGGGAKAARCGYSSSAPAPRREPGGATESRRRVRSRTARRSRGASSATRAPPTPPPSHAELKSGKKGPEGRPAEGAEEGPALGKKGLEQQPASGKEGPERRPAEEADEGPKGRLTEERARARRPRRAPTARRSQGGSE